LSDNDWALSEGVVYASTMGAFVMGIIPIGNKGSGAHEGLVVYVVAVDIRIEGFEGTPERRSRYQCSPTC